MKNPLAPIRAAVETLRRLRARNDPAFDEYFDEATRTVLDEVHRISDIVTEFTRFARLPAPRPQEIDLDEVVRHVVQLHRAAAGDNVRIVQSGPRVLPRLRADSRSDRAGADEPRPERARRGEGVGAARSTSAAAAIGDARVVGHRHRRRPGGPAEIAARLFEPYATTKAHGTGLGLAIAQRIALEHDGELAYLGPATSTAARSIGARFRLVLPTAGPPAVTELTPIPTD